MTLRLCKTKSALLCAAVLVLSGSVVTAAAGTMLRGTVAAAAGGMLGDADGDGEVTVNDITCIQRVLAELPAADGFSESAADVDKNGKVDILDATYLQQWLAEMQTPYPIGVQPTEAPTESPTDEDGWGREIFRP